MSGGQSLSPRRPGRSAQRYGAAVPVTPAEFGDTDTLDSETQESLEEATHQPDPAHNRQLPMAYWGCVHRSGQCQSCSCSGSSVQCWCHEEKPLPWSSSLDQLTLVELSSRLRFCVSGLWIKH